uniref:ATP synthase subunit a n=1 Tax=Ornithodoros zumpti TaxID=1827026 RepID=A0A1P8AGH5_9ACAR|nr:ATP synthase F0 subunit 6 [Ornithodoros zumpti]AMX74174.1 ATP synthase F0 subunit 6 [Ornithodoros zumpti]UYB78773.1 ATP synthase F0 subunit 6 [Ornithodoros zumpti]
MMTNLFSIFDPSSSESFSFNWMMLTLSIFVYPSIFWKIPSRLQTFWFLLLKSLYSDLSNIFKKSTTKFISIFMTIFWFILISNFFGLFPYIFTPTSHINITSSIALPMWISFMLFGWINQSNFMFSHLVPTGTPMFLSMFMVCIETISNLIRPLTLAVRLTANMISGHLLLCLLSNIMQNFPSMNLVVFTPLLILIVLEAAVAIIQSYVFVTLSSLYLNELNN